MTTQQSLYTLDHFTEDLDRIVRAHSNGSVDARAIVTEACPHFSKLLSDTSWMDPKFRVPEEGKSVSYMMAKAPDGVWTVVSVVWWPGYSTAASSVYSSQASPSTQFTSSSSRRRST
jgi:predicted metal-dependent enzyme (double-stranded beta helix superfamily)